MINAAIASCLSSGSLRTSVIAIFKQCHVRDLCRSRCECHLAELIASFTHADADGRNGTGASPVQDHQYTLEERA